MNMHDASRSEIIEEIYERVKEAEATHQRYVLLFYQAKKIDDGGIEKDELVIEGKQCSHEEFIGELESCKTYLHYLIEDETEEEE